MEVEMNACPVLPWQTDERGRPVVKIGHDVWYRIVFVEADGKKCPESRGRWHYEIEWKHKDRPWETVMQSSAAQGRRPRMYYSEHAAKLAVEDLPFPRSRR
jgi:hypothetical protein